MLLLSVFFVRTDKLQTSFWDHFCRRRAASACLTVSARSPARWRLSRWWEDLLLLRWKKAHLSTFTITAPLILMEGRLAYTHTHAHTLSASALLGLVWSNSHGFLTLLMSLVRVRVQVAFAGCVATCRSPPHGSDNTHFSAYSLYLRQTQMASGKTDFKLHISRTTFVLCEETDWWILWMGCGFDPPPTPPSPELFCVGVFHVNPASVWVFSETMTVKSCLSVWPCYPDCKGSGDRK